MTVGIVLAAIFLLLILFLIFVVIHDLRQKEHAILRNFPVIGHFRYLLEGVGPELRQYIVTDNNSEKPFNRDERRWVYASAKEQNSYFGFGTDNDLTQDGYVIIRHAAFPYQSPNDPGHPDINRSLPALKILGASHGRKYAFRPNSVVNVSGMSFGSLSGPAVEALNAGCKLAGAMQSTGEGGLSIHHKQGGDLVFQIGTGYFGCRTPEGKFSLERLLETVSSAPVKAIEVKLSQGAKPGLGGLLPGVKVTKEIADARGIPIGETCKSPAGHTAFHDVDSLLEFVETVAAATGLPVGLKSAVGEQKFWNDLAAKMRDQKIGPDFLVIDGGEGGTGAGPLVFTDHVAFPFRTAFSRVYETFTEQGITDDIVFVGSGKLGIPATAISAFAMGCDMINVGRTAMFAVGCIQAQRCHTDRCPTGVATQNPRLTRGLDPASKSVRCANYLAALRYEIERVAWACGVDHPAKITTDQIELIESDWRSQSFESVIGYSTVDNPRRRAS